MEDMTDALADKLTDIIDKAINDFFHREMKDYSGETPQIIIFSGLSRNLLKLMVININSIGITHKDALLIEYKNFFNLLVDQANDYHK